MTFLPKDYEAPKSTGKYTKFKQGDTKIRIVSSAITGWEWWTLENKPVRSKTYPDPIPSDVKRSDTGKPQIKHFWAFRVWNYQTEQQEICEVTQASIRDAMTAYVNDPDWGDPKEYDLVINRKGEELETKYSVIAKPKTKIHEDISKIIGDEFINLNALYAGEDPFAIPPEDVSDLY